MLLVCSQGKLYSFDCIVDVVAQNYQMIHRVESRLASPRPSAPKCSKFDQRSNANPANPANPAHSAFAHACQQTVRSRCCEFNLRHAPRRVGQKLSARMRQSDRTGDCPRREEEHGRVYSKSVGRAAWLRPHSEQLTRVSMRASAAIIFCATCNMSCRTKCA